MSNAYCPNCFESVNAVNIVTMSHHLLYPYCLDIPKDERFLFCRNPQCNNAYFSEFTRYTKQQMQSLPQIMNNTICYCFGITESVFLSEVEAGRSNEFFAALDELAYNRSCSCKHKNPTGKGCLKIFKKMAQLQSA